MQAIDTLQVLIEADATGLTSQLQKAGAQIESFVSSMNDQQISWTQVLSRDLTPALMASIASTFAIAITQALQFQNAVTNASQSAGTAFGSNSAAMSDAAASFSEKTGASATDTADAMGIIGQTFKDTADAQAVLNTVTEEAQIKGTSVASMATLLVPLFKEWGLSGADTANAMAVLNTSVAAGAIPFDTLISSLTDVGPSLKNVTDIQHAASEAELASVSPGMDAATSLNALKVAAQAVQNPLSNAGVLFSGLGNTIKTEGLGAAFGDMATKIQNAGSAAQVLYQQTGLAADSISHLQTSGVPALDAVDAAAAKLILDTKPLPDQLDASLTVTKKLGQAWNEFVTTLMTTVAPPIIKLLTDGLSLITTELKTLGEIANDPNGFFSSLKGLSASDWESSLQTGLSALPVFGTGNNTSVVDAFTGLWNADNGNLGVPAPQLASSSKGATSTPSGGVGASSMASSSGGTGGGNIIVNVKDNSGNPTKTGQKIGQAIKDTLHNQSQR